ncbi:MAG: insulinase family protein [Deltaproteobacteria bacterium]|nr:insulinase family protein [Deltaproteobacteria bacterium]
MSTSEGHIDPDFKKGDSFYGYNIEKVVELEKINSIYYELKHIATGARHIHIRNDDKENTFGVAFKTVPSDSTGVAHILEHTALCGSKKYPVRDPFFSMLKKSLSTFMNAFTASDWTMYPFSTQNVKDFYNLMDVYLDSSFFPNLEELSFKQEGHRLEFEDDFQDPETSKLTIKGVVYNEMKGAMSSPDQVMARSILNALYPSTTYHYNSGGDPGHIPDLTHDQLRAFHERHYHPSNSFFYTYGNLPLKDHLNFIRDKILERFEHIDPKTDVPLQPRWKNPKKKTYYYPLGENEDPEKKCQVCVAWLTADIRNNFEVLVLTLLEQILLGNPASPLRKALIDSELGTALCDGTGFDSDNRDTLFVCGLKDTAAASAVKIETIVFDVLKNLSENGIDKKLIESAIHQIEFHRKEITNTPYPYGLKLLLSFAGTWFHDGHPDRILQFDADLERLHHELSRESFFENRIKKYLIDNPHRVRLTLMPDQRLEQLENERLADRLGKIRSRMTPSDLKKIVEDAEALKQRQEGDENTSLLPTLEIEDIPPSVQIVKAASSYGSEPAVCFEQPTSGIFYFSGAAGVGLLEKPLLPLVSFFCHAFSKIGTTLSDYTEMAQLIDLYTGGVNVSPHVRTEFTETGGCVPFISFNGKCLVRNQDKMFEIIERLLCKFDFSDLLRLRSLLVEYRAGLEAMVVRNGHRLAISLASRNFSPGSTLSETWQGIHQLQYIKAITRDLTDDKLKSISDDLSIIGKTIFSNQNLKLALIGEAHVLPAASSLAASIKDRLAKGHGSITSSDTFASPEIHVAAGIPREGWSTSSAVSFVAQSFQTVRMVHDDAPALSVISKILRSLYLHREIREKGGAYGGFAVYNLENGLFSFGSYRDPHIVSTLKAYDNASTFIRSGNYTNEDVKEAILQVCSETDKPDTPGVASRKAFFRKMIALTDDMRQQFKERLLGLTRRQVIQVAEKYFDKDRENQAVAVISGEEKLTSANEKLAENQLELYRI